MKLTPATLRVTPRNGIRALNRIPADDRRALELAAERIAEFHRHTLEKSFIYRDQSGMRLGQMVQPLDASESTCPAGWARIRRRC